MRRWVGAEAVTVKGVAMRAGGELWLVGRLALGLDDRLGDNNRVSMYIKYSATQARTVE